MAYTDLLAVPRPFEGAPCITVPTSCGFSAGKPVLWRVSVLGQRPLRIRAAGLPEGLRLNENIITGSAKRGRYKVTLTADNALGSDTKTVTLEIGKNKLQRTPLLGFTTWNAFGSGVTDADVRSTADALTQSGIAEYGFSYVNIDSGWQGEYCGNVIAPNAKFPDMKALCSHVHALGLKCGIYSTPMLTAWGCPQEFASIPGCTRGRADERFALVNGGIGKEHLEAPNARQWSDWGFDYVKYDFSPTQPVNAAPMKKALDAQERDFAFCCTVSCSPDYAHWWSKNTNSWRCNGDTTDDWKNTSERLYTCDPWAEHVGPSHFYDLDMLALGPMVWNGGKTRFTPEEALFTATLHLYFPSPVQISTPIDKLGDLEKKLICNEEILAINQDALCDFPRIVTDCRTPERHFRLYRRDLDGGRIAYALFNLSDHYDAVTLPLKGRHACRDPWQKKDLGETDRLFIEAEAHCAQVRVLKKI